MKLDGVIVYHLKTLDAGDGEDDGRGEYSWLLP